MYDAIGITFFFTVYAYIGSSVHNRLIDFPEYKEFSHFQDNS